MASPIPTLALSLLLVVPLPASAQPDLPLVHWSDSDRATGELRHGVLTLSLEIVEGRWHFLGEEEPGVEIYAFAEAGEAPTNPGPMIRVPRGTAVDVSITSRIDEPVTIHGLAARKVDEMDELVVDPGETVRATFVADAEGTYYYWGTTGDHGFERDEIDSQLNGALIVDPPGAAPPENEEVLLMSFWADPIEREGEGPDYFANENFFINGRPWPHTERLAYDLGDTVRFRMINAIYFGHPMHLHGFFFDVEAKGDNERDRIFWPAERRQAVTEFFRGGETATLAFVADRPGGWIFHCHISYHVVPAVAVDEYESGEQRNDDLLYGHHEGDPDHHVVDGMGGLLMAFRVRPPEGWEPYEPKRAEHRLIVQSDSIPGERRRYAYVLAEEGRDPPPDSLPWPGSTIVAWEGDPTSVRVVNRLEEPTQVHWHGLEIDSFYDGVAGVGGHPGSVTPAIMPGDSFEMRITPPRAGSYMYHTHVSDIRQQSAGLYGAFIVLEEGEAWDPERDRVVMLSTGKDEEMSLLLNGSRDPGPIVLRGGETYRFRLMNITLFNGGARVRLVRDGYPVRWRAVAKDGADLPERLRTVDFADRVVSVGEIYDFEWRAPEEAAELTLEARSFGGRLFVEQPVRVTAAETAEIATD